MHVFICLADLTDLNSVIAILISYSPALDLLLCPTIIWGKRYIFPFNQQSIRADVRKTAQNCIEHVFMNITLMKLKQVQST